MKKISRRLLCIAPAIALLLFWPNIRIGHANQVLASYYSADHLLRADVVYAANPQTGAPVHSVVLTWTAGTADSTHIAATGFNVKRSATSGSGYATIGTTIAPTVTFTDVNVTAGGKYFYVVTGTAPGGLESDNSNEVAVTIPLDKVATPGQLGATSN